MAEVDRHSESRLEHADLTSRIIGAAIAVQRQLGPGFLENVYEAALAIELTDRRIPYERQLRVRVGYKGRVVGEHRLDLFAAETIVVELKNVRRLEKSHFTVVRSYLRAVSRDHGLLLNFGSCPLEIKRVSARPPAR